jgi:hypothetical protein
MELGRTSSAALVGHLFSRYIAVCTSSTNIILVLLLQHASSHFSYYSVPPFHKPILLGSIWCREMPLDALFLTKFNKFIRMKFSSYISLEDLNASTRLLFYNCFTIFKLAKSIRILFKKVNRQFSMKIVQE